MDRTERLAEIFLEYGPQEALNKTLATKNTAKLSSDDFLDHAETICQTFSLTRKYLLKNHAARLSNPQLQVFLKEVLKRETLDEHNAQE
jgi:hypothetical protein